MNITTTFFYSKNEEVQPKAETKRGTENAFIACFFSVFMYGKGEM